MLSNKSGLPATSRVRSGAYMPHVKLVSKSLTDKRRITTEDIGKKRLAPAEGHQVGWMCPECGHEPCDCDS